MDCGDIKMINKYEQVVKLFDIEGEVNRIDPFGDGHINDTYIVVTSCSKYILQRINTNVFSDYKGLIDNIDQVTKHLRSDMEYKTFELIESDGKKYVEVDGEVYRLMTFLDNTTSFSFTSDMKLIYEAGKGFGDFQKKLDSFDASTLVEVIPNFHNTPSRFRDFNVVLNQDKYDKASTCVEAINFVLDRQDYVSTITKALSEGLIPLRVTHNDTKINNILFDETTQKAVSVIDLDTVMPGSILYDYGDAIRSICSTVAEDEENLEKLQFDMVKFKSFTSGFLSSTKAILVDAEIDLLADGAIMMTLECGMRFLTDYLDGDNYFKVNRDRHNLIRALNQFKLVKKMEESKLKMKEIIKEKENKVTLSLIGAGDRGKDSYALYALDYPNDVEFIAVAEPNKIKRETFAKTHNISPEFAFESWEQLLELEKLSDGIIIATQDDMHFEPTKLAIEKGYDVLLEKPMSNDLKETIALGELSKQYDNNFMICHVLRYSPFFSKLKELIESGVIGDLMSIQHNENIGYYHMAHSFVRGNWRNSVESSPIILAKSCHDMDIILWLVGDNCNKLSSFGSLSHFKSSNAPEGAAKCCLDCSVENDCPYSALKLYYKHIGHWPSSVITDDHSEEGVTKALREGPYGRCVYHCDNDVCDHQVVNMEFNNNVTATFNLSAFTEKTHRTIKIMGTKGEIRGDDRISDIELSIFGEDKISKIPLDVVKGRHGGGDYGIMNDFINLLKGKEGKALTDAAVSVESHVMAFAAEQSRLNSEVVSIKAFYDNLK
jgi:predicted dehydrogenase/Ser/Thr protein kinase RdoA (MazF antagonist)